MTMKSNLSSGGNFFSRLSSSRNNLFSKSESLVIAASDLPMRRSFDYMNNSCGEFRATGRLGDLHKSSNCDDNASESDTSDIGRIIGPIQQIQSRKGDWVRVGTVEILRRQMQFSDRLFEIKYKNYLERSLRLKLLWPAIMVVAYALYSLTASNWFQNRTGERFIMKWNTSANILYNSTWLSFVLTGLFTMWVAVNKNLLQTRVEAYFQFWALYLLVIGILFGSRWRVLYITGTSYNAFSTLGGVKEGTNRYPDTDLVTLLVSMNVYLCIYADMRLRRVIWVAVFGLLTYAVTAIGFGIPVPTSGEENKPGNLTTTGAPSIATTAHPYEFIGDSYSTAGSQSSATYSTTGTSSNATTADSGKVDRVYAGFLSISMSCVILISLLGKFQLELLQRRNFLDLELAQKRLDLLERTVYAMDDKSQPHTQLEKTHQSLKHAERIIEKVRLSGMMQQPQANVSRELQSVLSILRQAEKSMTMLDFQKEVLLGPIKTGVEWKQEDVVDWLNLVLSSQDVKQRHISAALSLSQISNEEMPNMSDKPADNVQPIVNALPQISAFFNENDLGTSARSLMKQIGVEWMCHIPDLERTLRENQATEMSSLCLVARAILGPHMQVTLNLNVEVLANFARAVDKMYFDVPYHNSMHAAQSCHHVAILAEYTGVRKLLSRLDYIALCVSALCHDISHFGRTNAFLVECQHELATRYNDKSVLENFHAATTFEIMKSSPKSDIMAGLTRKEKEKFRSMTVQLILATDAAYHCQQISDLRMRINAGNILDDHEMEAIDKRIVLHACIRAADMGHSALPLEIHTMWMTRLMEEFAQQGDDERAMGFEVSPMCDRSKQNMPSMQLALLNYMVMPLYDELFNLIKIRNPKKLESFTLICGQLVRNREELMKIDTVGCTIRANHSIADSDDIFVPVPLDATDSRLLSYKTAEYEGNPDLLMRPSSYEYPADGNEDDFDDDEEEQLKTMTFSEAHCFNGEIDLEAGKSPPTH